MRKFLPMTILAFLLLSGVAISVSWAQTNNNSSVTSPSIQSPNDSMSTLLEYAKFMREESTAHREFLERFYTFSATALGGLVVAFGAVFTWLNYKTKADIREQVNQQFKNRIEGIAEERVKEFEERLQKKEKELMEALEQGRLKLAQHVKETNKIVLELSQQSTAPRIEPQSEIQSLIGKNVLWVDDHPENNEYPMEILTQAGVTIKIALSTEEALNKLQGTTYDLIISDMGRGTNSTAGLELLKELKKSTNKTPVIMYCGAEAVKEYGEQALHLGAISAVSGVSALLKCVFSALAPSNR